MADLERLLSAYFLSYRQIMSFDDGAVRIFTVRRHERERIGEVFHATDKETGQILLVVTDLAFLSQPRKRDMDRAERKMKRPRLVAGLLTLIGVPLLTLFFLASRGHWHLDRVPVGGIKMGERAVLPGHDGLHFPGVPGVLNEERIVKFYWTDPFNTDFVYVISAPYRIQ